MAFKKCLIKTLPIIDKKCLHLETAVKCPPKMTVGHRRLHLDHGNPNPWAKNCPVPYPLPGPCPDCEQTGQMDTEELTVPLCFTSAGPSLKLLVPMKVSQLFLVQQKADAVLHGSWEANAVLCEGHPDLWLLSWEFYPQGKASRFPQWSLG